MAFRLEFSVEAERDFGLIFDHLLQSYLGFGESLQSAFERAEVRTLEIRAAAERILTAPHRGERHDDLLPGLRHLAIWAGGLLVRHRRRAADGSCPGGVFRRAESCPSHADPAPRRVKVMMDVATGRRHVITARRRQYPGGGANRQYPSSINPAMCRHVRSSYWRPMIWMPTGRPFASPMGATIEGR